MNTVVGGKNIEYGVDEKTGIFKARWDGEEYTHTTLAGLKSALERQVKKKPLNIPVFKVESLHDDKPDVEKGVIVGVHSGNSNLLIRFEHGVEQYRGYRGQLLIGSADLKKMHALHRAAREAEKALENFMDKYSFNKHTMIKDDPEP